VAETLGHKVRRLVRTKIEFLEIGHLKPGQWRELTPREVTLLKEGKTRSK
jgi:23S rRNA pseudouridine2604 synthase